MKKFICISAAVAALFAISSCSKENISPAPEPAGKTVNIRFNAGNAGDTRTGVEYDSEDKKHTPYWNKGDEIGVFFDAINGKKSVDVTLANSNEKGAEALFSATGVSLNNGTEPGNAGTVYSFYPAIAFEAVATNKDSVRVNINKDQYPAAVNTYDPKADILVGEPTGYTFNPDGKNFEARIRFARVMSVVKISLKAGDECPEGLAVNRLTMTAPEGTILTGRVTLSLDKISGGNSPLGKWTVDNKEVSAIYEGEAKPVIGGEANNTVYLIVNPISIESGDVKFTIDTDNYSIEKTVTLSKALAFPMGNVANIGLTIKGENCTEKEAETRIWVENFDKVTEVSQATPAQTGAAGTGVTENLTYQYSTDITNVRVNNNGHGSGNPFLWISGEGQYLQVSNIAVSGETDLKFSCQVKTTQKTADVTLKYKESNADQWNTADGKISATTSSINTVQSLIFTISEDITSLDLQIVGSAGNLVVDDIVLEKFVDERTTLGTPANVTAAVDKNISNKINVTWDAVDNAGSYEVTLMTIGDQNVVETATTNSISFTDLEYLTSYSVKVKAISSDPTLYKDSEYSAAANVTTGAQPAVQVYYTKVTEALDDWSGEYLLVYESSATSAYVWTGVDAANCYVSAAISDNSISSLSIPTAGVTLTIATMEGGYSIKVNGGTNDGKFIYGTSGSNGLSFDSSPSLNTISYADNAVSIVSNTSVLRYNNASNNNRFRYFKSTSYSSQQHVQLYKLEESELSSIAVSGTPTKTSYSVGEAFDTDGLVATATYDNSSQKDVTNSVEWTVTPETLSAGTTSVKVVASYRGVESDEYVVNGLSVKALNSISVKTAPTKTTYTEGEKFNPAGLVIYRNYSDETKDEYAYAEHEDEFTFEPDLATALATSNTSVTITYSGKSVNQAISVNEVQALSTMDAIFAAATSSEADAKVKFNNWVVSGVKGSNAYVTDGTKGLIIYQSNHGFEVGDILSGTVSCKLLTYQGSSELKGVTATTTGLTVTEGGTITPASIAIADLTGAHTGAVITFESLSYNGSKFSDGVNTITPYNTFEIEMPTLTSGKNYTVTGIYIHYNGTKEIAPRATTDIVPFTGPYLNASASKTSDIAAAGETVTITVDTNIEGWTVTSDNAAFVVGTKSGNTVPVVVSENTSTTDTRSAKITVSATGVDAVEITLTQAKAGSSGTPTYTKVTSAPADWSGTYIMVYDGKVCTAGVDAASNYVEATDVDGVITGDFSACEVEIATYSTGYSIKALGGTNSGKFLEGKGSNSNGTTFANSASKVTTLSISGDVVTITNNSNVIAFNSASDNLRWRFFKSGTASSKGYYKPSLYKKN